MLILALYNFALSFSFQDISYIYYVILIVCFEAFSLMGHGLLFEFLPILQPTGQYLFMVSNPILVIALILFARSFLELPDYIPKFDLYFFVLIGVLAASVVFSQLTDLIVFISIRNYLCGFAAVVVLLLALRIYIKGYELGLYFALSMAPVVIFGILPLLASFDLIPVSFITSFGIEIGVMITVSLISLGLVYRVNNTRREKEEAQAEAILNLHKSDRLKDEFLANTSHELRTPLHGIIGIASSMLDGAVGKLTQPVIDNLTLITNSGKRLSNLINDILDFSKIRNQELEIKKRPVSIREVADIVIRLCTPLLRGDRLKIINKIMPDIPPVIGDEDRLQQIMYNLVGNAIKFTDSGEVTISAKVEKNMVSVTIADTGIGIPWDKLDTIFHSFEQLDASLTRQYGGTGIGLSITKNLIELHGGSISVNSKVGVGSQFTFTLPASAEDEKPIQLDTAVTEIAKLQADTISEPFLSEKDPSVLAANRNYKVLIVDDDPINLMVLHNQLSIHNYQIIEATNGREALAIVESENRPDIILLDLMMPHMNGFETTMKIREKFSIDTLPIIIVTARNNVLDLVLALESGASDYLAKPYSQNELIARVRLHIGLLKTSQQLRDHQLHLDSEVKERTREVQEQKQQIDDSIEYASTIQSSIFPLEVTMDRYLDDYFILWKPRDIVSGDFYWFFESGDNCLLALADCTGHGVPGAFMTMIAKSLLERVVEEKCSDDPARIIAELNIMVRRFLHREYEQSISNDGLDIGICYCMPKERKMVFASAGIHLFLNKSDEVLRIKGNRAGIGFSDSREDYVFTNHTVDLDEGDNCYLATDGFTDQIGGEMGFSFGKSRFMNLIKELKDKNYSEQKIAMERRIADFMGTSEMQRDDMSIFAFRVQI